MKKKKQDLDLEVLDLNELAELDFEGDKHVEKEGGEISSLPRKIRVRTGLRAGIGWGGTSMAN